VSKAGLFPKRAGANEGAWPCWLCQSGNGGNREHLASQRFVPFAFQEHSLEERGGVKGSLRREKNAPLTPPRPSNKSYREENEGRD
jgi:hypothetical protein